MEELQRAGLLWHPRELGRLASVTVAIPRTFCYFRNYTSLWTLLLFGQQSKVDSRRAQGDISEQRAQTRSTYTCTGMPALRRKGVPGCSVGEAAPVLWTARDFPREPTCRREVKWVLWATRSRATAAAAAAPPARWQGPFGLYLAGFTLGMGRGAPQPAGVPLTQIWQAVTPQGRQAVGELPGRSNRPPGRCGCEGSPAGTPDFPG